MASIAAAPFHLLSKLPVPKIGVSRSTIAVVLGAICAIALAAVVVINSSLFAATTIRIKGSAHVSQKAAEQLIELPAGTTLFNVDEDKVASELMKNPWVSGISVEREFPHTLVIAPAERKVAAVVFITADDIAWAVGDDGCWIAPISLALPEGDAEPQADQEPAPTDQPETKQEADSGDASEEGGEPAIDPALMQPDNGLRHSGLEAAQHAAEEAGALLFTDVSTDVSPASGKPVESSVVLAGLKYAEGFSPEFLKQIKFISLPSEEAISANLVSGVEVSLGEPDNIKTKERVVAKLLEQESGVTYINVRTPDAYTFRSVPQ